MTGYAICGSFCTHSASLAALTLLCEERDVIPIISYNAATTDTRFGTAKELLSRVESICSRRAVTTIVDAEPLGPKSPMDALIIAPCTGNTLAKLANGITDTPVTMAAKAHLRCSRPLVIALASNDALSANLKNIAIMAEKKNVYFVPMKQDDIENKPYSLVADFHLIEKTLAMAEEGRQIRPLFI